MKKIKFVRFSYKARVPKCATIDSTGYDLHSAEKVTIKPRSVKAVSTEIGIQNQYLKLVSKIYSRSSLSMKQIEVGAGVIDSGYRGVIWVVLHNHSDKDVNVNVGDRIDQIVFEKISLLVLIEVLDFTDQTERGSKGFGSTGK